MKRALGIVGLVASVALGAGCSNARSEGETANSVPLPEEMPPCSEQFQQGKTIEEASFGKACRTEGDELEVPRFVRLECADDRTLVWNEWAWGYVGQPMELFDQSASVRMPTEQALACRADATEITLPGQ